MRRPLAQSFALYAAIDARYGGEPKGPTYADQELLAAIRSASRAEVRDQKSEVSPASAL